MARRQGPALERAWIAWGIAVAAFIYLLFAVAGAAPLRWLAIEAAGLAGYGAVAWLGLRRAAWLVGAGWAAHVAWDLGHGASAFVPFWYPLLCIGFDVVLAVWGVARSGAWRQAEPGAAAV